VTLHWRHKSICTWSDHVSVAQNNCMSDSVDSTLNDCEIRCSLGRAARDGAARPRQSRWWDRVCGV